jgi:hypothetical protein
MPEGAEFGRRPRLSCEDERDLAQLSTERERCWWPQVHIFQEAGGRRGKAQMNL